jgi:soluble lytic murein transglycosylase-like protein
MAVPAQADVIELSPEGVISVRNGAGAATFEVAQVELQTQIDDATLGVELSGGINAATLPVPAQYTTMVERAAAAANISPRLLAALVWQESRWKANAVSPKGAIGLTQLMPGTARDLGVNPRDPMANLMGGARYLRQMLNYFDGDLERALAAYNAGPGRVRSARGIPAIAETRAYVRSIVQRASVMGAGETQ